MANISVSEKDFELLFNAANDANDRGDKSQAKGLDKLARKINAALSKTCIEPPLRTGRPHHLKWQDMPSTLKSK